VLGDGFETRSRMLQNASKPNPYASISMYFQLCFPYLVTFACHEERGTKPLQILKFLTDCTE
jgi:hypothetical protein